MNIFYKLKAPFRCFQASCVFSFDEPKNYFSSIYIPVTLVIISRKPKTKIEAERDKTRQDYWGCRRTGAVSDYQDHTVYIF